ncbi:MAG: CopG family transcriptional regulator [Clostridia bacterium]|nr:CopG family transcriptional regulator [Clostridia bacterium]
MDKKLTISKKSLKGEDGFKIFSIRLKNNIIEKLDELSQESGRSRNELINILLEFAVDNCEVV